MKTRLQRWTTLALCSVLGTGIGLVAVAGSGGTAGAAGGQLSVAPTSLNFGGVTLGDIAGPGSFTLTNTSSSLSDTITAVTAFVPRADPSRHQNSRPLI